MQILITGGTGFIGRSLVRRLLRDGHRVTVWSRRPDRAVESLGRDVAAIGGPAARLTEAVQQSDAVFNLAGEPVLGRWTARKKEAIARSRWDMTEQLATAIRAAPRPPEVFVSASAVGFFGHRSEPLTADSHRGDGFLADVCEGWEVRAQAAAEASRVVIIRIGFVLGLDGGALPMLRRVVGAGLGGPLGSGRQHVPWIHIDDLVEIFVRSLAPEWQGVYLGTAPHPVSQRTLMQALGKELRRPAFVPAPAPVIRMVAGQASEMFLDGQDARPTRLLEEGFTFRHAHIADAVKALFDLERAVTIERLPGDWKSPEASDYLARRKPRHRLVQTVRIAAPVADIFAFFSGPENLGVLTPPAIGFRMLPPIPAEIEAGSVLDHRVQVWGVPIRWRTVIERWTPGAGFVDAQHRGPYRCWWHHHRFEEKDGVTVMEDEVWLSVPGGPLGDLILHLFVGPMLRQIFGFRTLAMGQRFPVEDGVS